MRDSARLLARAAFGAAVAGILGFGTAQAVAAPSARAEASCDLLGCNDYCVERGYLGGNCTLKGQCICIAY